MTYRHTNATRCWEYIKPTSTRNIISIVLSQTVTTASDSCVHYLASIELQKHTERNMSNIMSNTLSEENLKKLRKIEGFQTFLYCRRTPAKNTRSHKIQLIFRSRDEIPAHLNTEWKKYLKRRIWRS